MAIFHFSAKVVSRSAGQSAVAKAAYISRERLTEERTGEIKDYRRAEGLQFSGIFTPANAPEWAHDREKLWNEAERAEKRKDATLAREYEIALPHELTDEQRRFLVQDFVKENFTRKGYAADVCIHAPDKEGDQRNYHAHILVTDRRLEEDGFAKNKLERHLKSHERKAELEHLRERWEHHANRHLERHGHSERIDRRSLEDQGIDREPTKHLGPTATQLEREDQETERGNINREIKARNQEREQLEREGERAILDRVALEKLVREAAREKEQEREREARAQAPPVPTKAEPERQPAAPIREAEAIGGGAGRAADALAGATEQVLGGLADFFVGPTEKPRPKTVAERVAEDRAARAKAREGEERPRTVAERLAEARAATLEELERWKSLDDDERRKLEREREEERRRERERWRGGRERER